MATKIKGIYKSFKFISQIFAIKEREIEIGYPTDVKHVAHIGLDGSSLTSPTWMNDFRTPSGRLANTNAKDSNSLTNFSPWSSQDFDQSIGNQELSLNSWNNVIPSSDPPSIPKKSKRKKKSSSSPTSLSCSWRASLPMKSKSTLQELEPTTNFQI